MSAGSARVWRIGAVGALAGWWAATFLSQHPLRNFDVLRRRPSGALFVPDWRFFAPEPGQWDNHVMVRTRERDGTVTPWRAINTFHPRRLVHAVYFPGHRQEKALLDVVSNLMLRIRTDPGDIADTTDYELLRHHIAHRIRRERAGSELPEGFQFLLLRDAGHAVAEELEARLVSRFERLDAE